MKLLKCFLLIILATMLCVGTASADPFYMNVGAAGSAGLGDADTLTQIMDQVQIYADTTTVQYDTDASGGLSIGDRFTDEGEAVITGPLPPPASDFEGINSVSEITVDYSGLTGTTTFISADKTTTKITYDAGTLINFYFDEPGDADFGALGKDGSGFTDGTPVLTLTVTGGSGQNDFDAAGNFISGSSHLNAEVTSVLDDFWWFEGGDGTAGTGDDADFDDLLGLAIPIELIASIDQNTDYVQQILGGVAGPDGFGAPLFTINSNHDGSIDFSVPEPSAILLLGFGMIGLATFGRKRIFSKK